LALHHAVWEGNSELIRLLLDNGTHVDKRHGVTETLLALAALGEHNDILELLIRQMLRSYTLPINDVSAKFQVVAQF